MCCVEWSVVGLDLWGIPERYGDTGYLTLALFSLVVQHHASSCWLLTASQTTRCYHWYSNSSPSHGCHQRRPFFNTQLHQVRQSLCQLMALVMWGSLHIVAGVLLYDAAGLWRPGPLWCSPARPRPHASCWGACRTHLLPAIITLHKDWLVVICIISHPSSHHHALSYPNSQIINITNLQIQHQRLFLKDPVILSAQRPAFKLVFNYKLVTITLLQNHAAHTAMWAS